MSKDWLEEATAWRRLGEDFVLVTILAVRGSAPCEVGRRMIVAQDRQHGTVGGGRLEQEVLEEARNMIEGSGQDKAAMDSLSLGARLGQCCGGKVIVHYETMQSSLPAIALFGAGHVGQELARILARLPNPLTVVDSRQDWLDKLLQEEGIETVFEPEPVDAVAGLPSGSVCLVLTHRHDLDLEICRALIARGDMNMVGVIGSRSKAVRFRHEIDARGLDGDELVCPIGKKAGKDPASVAISMAARVCEQLSRVDDAKDKASKNAQRMLDEIVASGK